MRALKMAAVETGFLIVFLFSGCKKEYSYEGGVAVFSLLNVNGSCVDLVVSGSYITGSALGSSHTVELKVDVARPGKFSLQTNSRSGFQFSVSGSFSDTGIQTVILTGSGRPDSIGTFIFTPELESSCAFSVEVSGQQVLNAGYTIAGAPDACTNFQVNGYYQNHTVLTSANTVVISVHVASPGDYKIHTDTLDGISFSASGHFDQTGDQLVTLSGAGTPVIVQNLQFTIQGEGSSCSFPLTVANPGNSAIYVIESGSNFCIGNLVGPFTAGIALSSSNTYTLSVYVSVPGNFTISTAKVNGVSFYYSNVFNSPGRQTVTLTDSGTPVAIGTFTYTPQIVGPHPLGGQACDFIMDVK